MDQPLELYAEEEKDIVTGTRLIKGDSDGAVYPGVITAKDVKMVENGGKTICWPQNRWNLEDSKSFLDFFLGVTV